MFIEVMTTTDGAVYNKRIHEVLQSPSNDKKMKFRHDIEKEVFDIHDSVADNAKWLSLLSTMVSKIYSILPEEQKALLSTEDREVMEYAISKFDSINTRADIQFQQEGTGLIDKILDRQEQVSQIVK